MFGMMGEEKFYNLQSTKQTIHSYRVLDIMDIVSYDPPDSKSFPTDGVISKHWVKKSSIGYPPARTCKSVTDKNSSQTDQSVECIL